MKKIIRIFLFAGIGLLMLTGLSYFWMKQTFVPLHDIFENEQYIEVVDGGEPGNVYDVTKTQSGYVVSGTDALFVYPVSIDKCRALEVVFDRELDTAGNVQVFYAAENEVFSEENSIRRLFSEDDYSVRFPIEIQGIQNLRVDIEAAEGTIVNITSIRWDNREVQLRDIVRFPGFYLCTVIYLLALCIFIMNSLIQ